MTQTVWMHPRGDMVRAFAEAPQSDEIMQRLKQRLETEDQRMKLRIKRLDKDMPLPSYGSDAAAGLDLRARETGILLPGQRMAIPTGIAVEIPEGFEGQVRPRSGLALRHGIGMVNAPGTIDADYRGEVHVIAINHGAESWTFHRGDRIAQLVIAPVIRVQVEEASELSDTERGAKGFGSTGVA